MDYSGTLYVKGKDGSDYIGVVFGYQSNRKFYVAMWRRENLNFANSNINTGIKGLQLKVTKTVLLLFAVRLLLFAHAFASWSFLAAVYYFMLLLWLFLYCFLVILCCHFS